MGARPIPVRALIAALAALAVAAAPAAANDPGRWRIAKVATVPLAFNQGLTPTSASAFVFASNASLFLTSSSTLAQRRVQVIAIPAEVTSAEGYDHIGDPSYDQAEGGRLILPLECFRSGGPNAGNHCGTGSIGVASPATLQWRYYVRLDPRDIQKAMWAEVSPDGRSLWTQAGSTLLRYAMKDVTRANAAPTGKVIRPVQRLRGALPPGQMTGATFVGRRLFVASQPGRMQVHSIDLRTGKRRLEIDRPIRGEAEGLATLKARGGTLHWLIAPFDPQGRTPTYGGGDSALLTFARRR